MLTGPNLTLRAIERDDVPRIHAINNDLEIELLGGGDPPYPQSLARAYTDFDRRHGEGSPKSADFAIEADGRLVGFCGLYRRDEVAQTAELGITIGDRDYLGRGYGREAIGMLLDYGFRMLNLQRVYLNVNARNSRAIRAYLACGFVEEGRLRRHVWSAGDYDDLVYMGVLRDEWTGVQAPGEQRAAGRGHG